MLSKQIVWTIYYSSIMFRQYVLQTWCGGHILNLKKKHPAPIVYLQKYN